MKHRMALRTPVDGNVDEVVFTPIGNDATRVAALLSGEIDVMEPVPLQDVERVKSSGKFNVLQGPELRTIFLGMDQRRDELLFDGAICQAVAANLARIGVKLNPDNRMFFKWISVK